MIDAVTGISAWRLLLTGGPVMVPVLICSVGVTALVIERFLFLGEVREGIAVLSIQVAGFIQNNNTMGALSACDAADSSMARIFKAGLLSFGQSAPEIQAALEDAARQEVRAMEKGLDLLAFMAQLVPLIGLLGTVVGLCGLLHTIQLRAVAVNPASLMDVTAGLGQALITTAAASLVGIFAMIAHRYFLKVIEGTVLLMEQAASTLVREIWRRLTNRD